MAHTQRTVFFFSFCIQCSVILYSLYATENHEFCLWHSNCKYDGAVDQGIAQKDGRDGEWGATGCLWKKYRTISTLKSREKKKRFYWLKRASKHLNTRLDWLGHYRCLLNIANLQESKQPHTHTHNISASPLPYNGIRLRHIHTQYAMQRSKCNPGRAEKKRTKKTGAIASATRKNNYKILNKRQFHWLNEAKNQANNERRTTT